MIKYFFHLEDGAYIRDPKDADGVRVGSVPLIPALAAQGVPIIH
jgi:hypothetical protein